LSRDDFAQQYAHGMVCRSHSTSHAVELVDPISSIALLSESGLPAALIGIGKYLGVDGRIACESRRRVQRVAVIEIPTG
jgi:hypothetical protein